MHIFTDSVHRLETILGNSADQCIDAIGNGHLPFQWDAVGGREDGEGGRVEQSVVSYSRVGL